MTAISVHHFGCGGGPILSRLLSSRQRAAAFRLGLGYSEGRQPPKLSVPDLPQNGDQLVCTNSAYYWKKSTYDSSASSPRRSSPDPESRYIDQNSKPLENPQLPQESRTFFVKAIGQRLRFASICVAGVRRKEAGVEHRRTALPGTDSAPSETPEHRPAIKGITR